MLKIPSRMGRPESKTSGTDTLEKCVDREHYKSYTKHISYRYNSRGFRDHEWPEDLSDVVWCVGDSFTVGIGQPFEETWPQLLENKTGKRCLNIGQDGCANDTMALRIQEICKLYKPKLIVVMWSYFSRRRIDCENVRFDKNDFGFERDIKNFHKNFKIVNGLPTSIVNLLIPYAFDNVRLLKETYTDLVPVIQLDYARDYHHFDIKTSTGICDLIERKINK